MMRIIEPETYLAALGWLVEEQQDGSQRLVQGEARAEDLLSKLPFRECPSTELELLSSLLNIGYLPEEAFDLLQRMSMSSNGLMTTLKPALDKVLVPYTREKIDFINTIHMDPLQATKELFGSEYDKETIVSLGVKIHDVQDVNSISHLPMQVPYPDPRLFYNYSTSHAPFPTEHDCVMQFEDIQDYDTFDIDSPWDLDIILRQTQTEGERSGF